jgi:uncharacterized protein (DUF58 family)
MKNFWNSLFINSRFFYSLGLLALLLVFGFVWPILFFPARLVLLGFVIICLLEVLFLFASKRTIDCARTHSGIFSLGDPNTITLHIHNKSNKKMNVTLLEELPFQLQIRDMKFHFILEAKEEKTLQYVLTPKERGLYQFYHSLLFISGPFSLFQRRLVCSVPTHVAVYPSILQVKKYQLRSNVVTNLNGLRKIRRIGHNNEFDHIKNYVKGDDYRSINWKMTGKRNALMVNQYDDERSQQIYSIVDTGRSMRMPFGGQSLLDYSINTALVLANTATQKHDKTGLISFSKNINTFLKADSGREQLSKVFQRLYAESESDLEADFERLYYFVRKNIKVRSVFFLFTNFESNFSLQRVLPILRILNKLHLLVIVLYENNELKQLASQKANTIDEIYTTTLAEKMVYEKKQLATIIRQHGIQTISTQPEDLSINTVNKYLELKSRGLA